MTAEPKLLPLRIRLPYATEEEFVEKYGYNVVRGGLFIALRAPKPEGARLAFELVLASGARLLRGDGVVVRVHAGDDTSRPGMTVRFNRLDAPSKALVDRIVTRRSQETLDTFESGEPSSSEPAPTPAGLQRHSAPARPQKEAGPRKRARPTPAAEQPAAPAPALESPAPSTPAPTRAPSPKSKRPGTGASARGTANKQKSPAAPQSKQSGTITPPPATPSTPEPTAQATPEHLPSPVPQRLDFTGSEHPADIEPKQDIGTALWQLAPSAESLEEPPVAAPEAVAPVAPEQTVPIAHPFDPFADFAEPERPAALAPTEQMPSAEQDWASGYPPAEQMPAAEQDWISGYPPAEQMPAAEQDWTSGYPPAEQMPAEQDWASDPPPAEQMPAAEQDWAMTPAPAEHAPVAEQEDWASVSPSAEQAPVAEQENWASVSPPAQQVPVAEQDWASEPSPAEQLLMVEQEWTSVPPPAEQIPVAEPEPTVPSAPPPAEAPEEAMALALEQLSQAIPEQSAAPEQPLLLQPEQPEQDALVLSLDPALEEQPSQPEPELNMALALEQLSQAIPEQEVLAEQHSQASLEQDWASASPSAEQLPVPEQDWTSVPPPAEQVPVAEQEWTTVPPPAEQILVAEPEPTVPSDPPTPEAPEQPMAMALEQLSQAVPEPAALSLPEQPTPTREAPRPSTVHEAPRPSTASLEAPASRELRRTPPAEAKGRRRALLDMPVTPPVAAAPPEVILGIDFGTSQARVAVYHGGTAQLVPLGGAGPGGLPSIVAVDDEGNLLVGAAARAEAERAHHHAAEGLWRLLGLRAQSPQLRALGTLLPFPTVPGPLGEASIELRGRVITLPEFGALLLRELKEAASAFLGHQATRAILCVPAHFNDRQRAAMREAGTLAGLTVLRVLNAPSAAALAFAHRRGLARKRILVIDLGGGGLEVSVIQLTGGDLEIVTTDGDPTLGGMDFDARIAEAFANELQEQGHPRPEHPLDWGPLRAAAEYAKVTLSEQEEALVSLVPGALPAALTRERLEVLTADLVQRVTLVVRQVLESNALSPQGLDEVLLVGGQSRSLLVRRRLEESLGVPVRTDVDPVGSAALGAALFGRGLLDAEAGKPDITISEVLTQPIGVAERGGVLRRVLERNTRLPANKTLVIPVLPGPLSLPLFQGPSFIALENEYLGALEFTVERPGEVEVHFSLSSDGTLSLAVTLPGGKRHRVTLNGESLDEPTLEALMAYSPLESDPGNRPGGLLSGLRKLFGRR